MASSMALIKRAKTTNTSALFTKVLSTVLARSATARSSSSSTAAAISATASASGTPHVFVKGPIQKFESDNPFNHGYGPGWQLVVDNLEKGLFVRVAMPGVGAEGLKVWAEKNTVFFSGSGEIELEGEGSGRQYAGSVELFRDYEAGGVTAEMNHGILRLLIPRAEGVEMLMPHEDYL